VLARRNGRPVVARRGGIGAGGRGGAGRTGISGAGGSGGAERAGIDTGQAGFSVERAGICGVGGRGRLLARRRPVKGSREAATAASEAGHEHEGEMHVAARKDEGGRGTERSNG